MARIALGTLALIVRSKNAGPFTITLDVILPLKGDCFWSIARQLSRELIANLYGVEPERVQVVYYERAGAIKANIPRRIAAGEPGDHDVYGAQQHAPLLEVEIDVPDHCLAEKGALGLGREGSNRTACRED